MSLKLSNVTLNAAEFCQLLCNTLLQVGQLQQQLNEDGQQTMSFNATGIWQ